MFSIRSCPVPDAALLARYRDAGAFTDSYVAEVDGIVTQAQYVAAFYTTALFKLERLILKWAVARPSTDAEAAQLAAGSVDAFAAWRVEERSANQLLMCDIHGRTRSWLMTEISADGANTRLYFGSAVVPVHDAATGKSSLGGIFRALLGFHRLYSIALLRAAKSRLLAMRR